MFHSLLIHCILREHILEENFIESSSSSIVDDSFEPYGLVLGHSSSLLNLGGRSWVGGLSHWVPSDL